MFPYWIYLLVIRIFSIDQRVAVRRSVRSINTKYRITVFPATLLPAEVNDNVAY